MSKRIQVVAEFDYKDNGLLYATSQITGKPDDAELCRFIGKALDQVVVDYNTHRHDLKKEA